MAKIYKYIIRVDSAILLRTDNYTKAWKKMAALEKDNTPHFSIKDNDKKTIQTFSKQIGQKNYYTSTQSFKESNPVQKE